ncbi:MAG: secretin N-terminal domain-containing protein [Planctomycetota bacterium]|jgi:hypothetical protein
MKKHPNAKTNGITRLLLFLTACVCTLPIGTSYGQEGAKHKSPRRRVKVTTTQPVTDIRIVRVVLLKHADATHVSQIINHIFKGNDISNTVTCAADKKTNSIIISMPENIQKKVEELLPKLDFQQTATPTEPVQTRIYALSHISAKELARTLGKILGREARCEYSGNSIVIAARKNLQEQAEGIIKQLDQPYIELDLETQIFKLKNVAFRDIERSFDFMTQGKGIRYTLDKKRNALIVKAAPQNMPLVQETLSLLDMPDPQKLPPKKEEPQQSMLVRVVWLISGNEKLQTDPPADLKDVIAELGKVGVSNLKLADQNIVQVLAEQKRFEMTSTPPLGERCNLHIEGELHTMEQEKTRLQISLVGELELQRDIESPFRLETTIQTPTGHSTVLGALSSENFTSVFVVQVLPGI